jgi:hypothetical protein
MMRLQRTLQSSNVATTASEKTSIFNRQSQGSGTRIPWEVEKNSPLGRVDIPSDGSTQPRNISALLAGGDPGAGSYLLSNNPASVAFIESPSQDLGALLAGGDIGAVPYLLSNNPAATTVERIADDDGSYSLPSSEHDPRTPGKSRDFVAKTR